MGEIIDSKTAGNRMVYRVAMDEREALNLKGNINNIRIFSPDLCTIKSRIVEKGLGGVTKHFLIPLQYQSKSKRKPMSLSYNTIDLDTRSIFIYILNKN